MNLCQGADETGRPGTYAVVAEAYHYAKLSPTWQDGLSPVLLLNVGMVGPTEGMCEALGPKEGCPDDV